MSNPEGYRIVEICEEGNDYWSLRLRPYSADGEPGVAVYLGIEGEQVINRRAHGLVWTGAAQRVEVLTLAIQAERSAAYRKDRIAGLRANSAKLEEALQGDLPQGNRDLISKCLDECRADLARLLAEESELQRCNSAFISAEQPEDGASKPLDPVSTAETPEINPEAASAAAPADEILPVSSLAQSLPGATSPEGATDEPGNGAAPEEYREEKRRTTLVNADTGIDRIQELTQELS